MPLYMDIHRGMKGMRAEDIARTHERELRMQELPDVKLRSCWYTDKGKEATVICLAEAPNMDVFDNIHRGRDITGEEIIEVHETR